MLYGGGMAKNGKLRNSKRKIEALNVHFKLFSLHLKLQLIIQKTGFTRKVFKINEVLLFFFH